jgi:hypothetical protein
MIPNDVRETPSLSVGLITPAVTHTPRTAPKCSTPPPVLEERQSLPSAAAPAIRILRRIFSVSNLERTNPEVYTVRAIRELYLGAHARGMLGDLSGPQFSAMISLFGTLSVQDPPSQFNSPLAQHIDKGKFRAWWGFVFQMVRDKRRVTGILTQGDLYWLMRAKASEASLVGLDVYAGGDGKLATCPDRAELRSI